MPFEVPTYTTEDLRNFPQDGQRYELVQGTLLVTPAPSLLHQEVVARLFGRLRRYLADGGPARVVSPGEIEVAPRILMDPDLLVFSCRYPLATPWTAIRDWWLAVEVYSPSSRIYDRDFKRPTYLSLGVRETWMVDPRERTVTVSRPGTAETVVMDCLVWKPRECTAALELEVAGLFEGV